MSTSSITSSIAASDDSDSEFVATVVEASPEVAPTLATHGIDVSYCSFVTICFKATSTTAWTAQLYGSPDEGTTWCESEDDEVTGTTRDKIKVVDVRGLDRLAVRLTSVTGTSVKRHAKVV